MNWLNDLKLKPPARIRVDFWLFSAIEISQRRSRMTSGKGLMMSCHRVAAYLLLLCPWY